LSNEVALETNQGIEQEVAKESAQEIQPQIKPQKPRKYWIDSIRGIAMILVVVVHASQKIAHWDIYNIFFGGIMLPMFFAVTGYVFSIRDGKQWPFYKGLLLKLVLPWVLFSFIWAKAFMIPFKGFHPFYTERLYKFVSGKTLWWFSCCIIAEIIQFYIQKFLKKPMYVCIADLLLATAGLLLAYYCTPPYYAEDRAMFLNINNALLAQFYMMIGYLFKRKEDFFGKIKWVWVIILACVYVALGLLSRLVFFPGRYPDMNQNLYPNIPYSMLSITIGVFVVFLIAKKTNLRFKPLVFIGQNTLLIYAIHYKFIGLMKKFLEWDKVSLSNNWGWALLMSAISIALCSVCAIILNKFLPEAVGKRRKKRKKEEQSASVREENAA